MPALVDQGTAHPRATSGCPLSAVRLSGLDRIRCPGSPETRVRFRPNYAARRLRHMRSREPPRNLRRIDEGDRCPEFRTPGGVTLTERGHLGVIFTEQRSR